MTIAICVRVGEGVALAADSVSVLGVAGGSGIGQVYQGTRKLIRPRPDLPVAMVTYGQGTLADQSIAQLAIALRERLAVGGAWEVDPANYTVQGVAGRIGDYYSERVAAANGAGHPVHTPVGLLVAGYSSAADRAEIHEIVIAADGHTSGPVELDPGANASLQYRGFTSPLQRMIEGGDANHLQLLAQLGAVPNRLQLVRPEMPLPDAVQLADWLAGVMIGAVTFSQIAPIVGGDIDLGHISREHGFVWARQKHLLSDATATDELA